MASGWSRSNRRKRLPSNWPALRRQVLARDRVCQWRLPGGGLCGIPAPEANQVDHIVPGDCHDLANLQLLCERHHRLKTNTEGYAATYRRKQEALKRMAREEEAHPGTIAAPGAVPIFPWQIRLKTEDEPPPF